MTTASSLRSAAPILAVCAAFWVAACTAPDAAPATPATPPAAAGTPEDPIPPGAEATVGDYAVSVRRVTADATQEVVSEYHENDPPPDGTVYPLIGITIRFVGEGAGQFTFDTTFSLEGRPGNAVVYTRAETCGTIPDDVVYLGQFFPDSPTAEGNLCRAVPPGELADLLVHLKPNLPREDPGVWFALSPPE